MICRSKEPTIQDPTCTEWAGIIEMNTQTVVEARRLVGIHLPTAHNSQEDQPQVPDRLITETHNNSQYGRYVHPS